LRRPRKFCSQVEKLDSPGSVPQKRGGNPRRDEGQTAGKVPVPNMRGGGLIEKSMPVLGKRTRQNGARNIYGRGRGWGSRKGVQMSGKTNVTHAYATPRAEPGKWSVNLEVRQRGQAAVGGPFHLGKVGPQVGDRFLAMLVRSYPTNWMQTIQNGRGADPRRHDGDPGVRLRGNRQRPAESVGEHRSKMLRARNSGRLRSLGARLIQLAAWGRAGRDRAPARRRLMVCYYPVSGPFAVSRDGKSSFCFRCSRNSTHR